MTEQATDNARDFTSIISEECIYITTAAMGLEEFIKKAPYGPNSKGARAVSMAATMLYETAGVLRAAIEAPAVEPEQSEEKGDGDNVAVVPVQCTDKDNEQGQPGAQGDEV